MRGGSGSLSVTGKNSARDEVCSLDWPLLAQQALAFTATPCNPSAYPLAVRSPCLSTWLPGGSNGGQLNPAWPTFWQGAVSTSRLRLDASML
jgi:hypothetical protein